MFCRCCRDYCYARFFCHAVAAYFIVAAEMALLSTDSAITPPILTPPLMMLIFAYHVQMESFISRLYSPLYATPMPLPISRHDAAFFS